MNNEVNNKIAELEKELYAKNFTPHKVTDILQPKKAEAVSGWDRAREEREFLEEQARATEHHKKMKKFFLVSFLFFLIAAGVSGYVWWKGGNVISGENIIVDTVAPVDVKGGESFESKFTLTNNNSVPVDSATLLVEYPPGFYATSDKSELLRTSRSIGSLAPGQSLTESISTVLYGEENTQKEVRVALEYRMSGSNATLKKSSTYVVKIASSPLNVKLKMLKEASSGQDIEMAVDIDSNSVATLNDLLFTASYPAGFVFKSAIPPPTYGNNVWDIGTLQTQGKRTIKISGTIEGDEGDEKVAQISLGARSKKDERVIGVAYTGATESLKITRPFLGVDFVVNGTRATEYTVSQGRTVRVDLSWVNNNPTAITDAIIEVKLKGEMLNRYSIYASHSGFYRSVDDTIVWDKSRNPDLAVIEPGARGTMSFSFSPIPTLVENGKIFKNGQIVLEARARARRTSDVNVPEEVVTLTTRTVKIETDVRLSVHSSFYSGPFKNLGVLPPKADKETTYTVSWLVRNASNNMSDVSVRTTLPIYVKWRGFVAPQGEDVAYTEGGAEVVWNVGRIPSGGSREVSFQVSFLPSLSQLGTTPPLTGESTLVGTDDFTKTELRDRKSAVTINLASDPQFSQNEGVVVR